MAEHEHTDRCAERSQYVLVEVKVHALRSGRAECRILMKPSARCWADVEQVAHVRLDNLPYPDSKEMAAEVAAAALHTAFPGLF